jgi:patatin-related protein
VSTPEQTASPAKTSNEEMDVQREVRFAVVMYGGVSLAIYINGVAQELLNIVRSTAPKAADSDEALLSGTELTGAMSVYRKLGQYLAMRDKEARSKKLIQSKPINEPIRVRFVVDVISGTSAGGINGVFLAKALARNQGMAGLKQLWLSEGDLGKLLNDKRSVRDLRGFKVKRPQASLLNSQRMYRKLLEALDNMDTARAENTTEVEKKLSPLVRELDLFITTTDIDGIPLPIGLSDEVVYERRYKNVFHFRYATPEATGSLRDDFIKENDPFLAFAARCTSSFPFAFEAMRLSDITDIANGYSPYKDKTSGGNWDKFFSDYLRNGLFDLNREAQGRSATGRLPNDETSDEAKEQLRASFRDRSFGDGGYLDNKPFSYATSMLSRRYADSGVVRKLLYVEPTPEHPELAVENREVPDFAENVRAAVLDLPRQETIREDIDRLYERNEILERVTVLAKEVDADIEADNAQPIEDRKFKTQGLNQMIDHYGVSYGAYHRLKITELTGVLAELIARAAGHDPTSDAADAIRELVRAWRRSEYHPLQAADRKDPNDNSKKTENEFLLNFDIRYDIRRLGFLNRRINQLIELDSDAARLLEAVRTHASGWPENLTVRELIDQHGPDFQKELNRLKKDQVAPALKEARAAEEKLRNHDVGPGRELFDEIPNLHIGWPDLEGILNCDPGAAREAKANEILKGGNRGLVLSGLAIIVSNGLKRHESVDIPPASPSLGTSVARVCLKHYKANFIYYDLVTYPIQYGTGAGETNVVDVFRVSPEDAKNLVDERASGSDATKLAGRTLMSFGAFLDESWRRNDMLWGRLDGAERIISALLPEKVDCEARKHLINEAHVGIFKQEIEEGNADAVCKLLSHALAHTKSQEPCGNNLQDLVTQVLTQNAGRLNDAQKTALTVPQTLDRQLQPRRALEYISRSTNITGDMLSGLSDKYQFERGKRVSGWIARLGTVLWQAIAVAVPQSLASLFFRHWLGLLYFVAFTLIIFGVVLNNSVKFAGWQLLGIVVLVHLVVSTLSAGIRGKHFMKLAGAIVAFVLLSLVVIGGLHLIDLFRQRPSLTQTEELFLAAAVALGIVLLAGIASIGRAIEQRVPKISQSIREQFKS